MTDPTPEERAESIVEFYRLPQKPVVRLAITNEIREAVEAERERCLDLVGSSENRLEVCAAIRALKENDAS